MGIFLSIIVFALIVAFNAWRDVKLKEDIKKEIEEEYGL